jgi:hypothetical protein
MLPRNAAGLGVLWTIQLRPSHRSASDPPTPLMSPTAVQATGEVQDTPESLSRWVAAGLGVLTAFQAVPFHRSASTCAGPTEKLLLVPTAVHARPEVHETPWSAPDPAGEFGVGWIVQLEPFQRSANVRPVPAALM